MGKVKEPNFFIVGAAKCGTTSLVDCIKQHPGVYIPPVKEPFHFVKNSPYDGYSEEDVYLSLFEKAGSATALGEASTGYLFDEGAAVRIHNKFPSAKIIIILRNPSDMVFSFWHYEQVCGDEQESFEYVISDAGRKYRSSKEFKDKCRKWWANYAYMDRGLYSEQVRRYYDVFGRDNVRVYIFERLIKYPEVIYRDIFEFLGIAVDFIPDYGKVSNPAGKVRSKLFKKVIYSRHPWLRALFPPLIRGKIRAKLSTWNIARAEKEEMPLPAREYLESFFSSDIKKLEDLLGYEIDEWRKK